LIFDIVHLIIVTHFGVFIVPILLQLRKVEKFIFFAILVGFFTRGIILLGLVLLLVNINDSIGVMDTQVREHIDLRNKLPSFDKFLLLGLPHPELTVVGVLLHEPKVLTHLLKDANLLLVLEQLHLVGVLDDGPLLLEVPCQQREGTVDHHDILIQNNVQQNTNEVFFRAFGPHVQILVLKRNFHPVNGFFIGFGLNLLIFIGDGHI
jgi:hypothetical protein